LILLSTKYTALTQYTRKMDKLILTWVAGYIGLLRFFTRPRTVTHPSTNRGRRRATTLPLSHTAISGK